MMYAKKGKIEISGPFDNNNNKKDNTSRNNFD